MYRATICSAIALSVTAAAQVGRKTSASPVKPATSAGAIKVKGVFEPVNYPEDMLLLDVHFADENTGWVAGENNQRGGGVILYTTNAGKKWDVQVGDPKSQERGFKLLRFADATNGWAIQPTGMASKLLHTTDGQSWSEIGKVPEHMADYEFVSPTDGFVATGQKILRTSDAGRTWSPVYTCAVKVEVNGLARQAPCEFQALDFPSSQVGYALGFSSVAKGMFFVAKTEDGGSTWDVWGVESTAAPREGDLHFTSATTGTLRDQSGTFFLTADGGKTWSGVPGAKVRGKPDLAASGPVEWAIAYNVLAFTTDAGKRWTTREVPFPAAVKSYCLPKTDRGYVVGEHGMIYRYRVVPTTYKAAGMIEAPVMPGSGNAGPAE